MADIFRFQFPVYDAASFPAAGDPVSVNGVHSFVKEFLPIIFIEDLGDGSMTVCLHPGKIFGIFDFDHKAGVFFLNLRQNIAVSVAGFRVGKKNPVLLTAQKAEQYSMIKIFF